MKRINLFLCIFATLIITSCSSDNRYLQCLHGQASVYSEEDENGSVIGYLSEGETVEITEEEWNGWFKVDYNGSEGYVIASNTKIIDENGEQIWMTKSLFRGLGIAVGIIILIGLALALFALIAAGIAFIIGLIMRIIAFAAGGAFLGWILGYAASGDTESTFKFICAGAIIGTVIAIVRIIMHPSKESDAGLDTAADAVKSAKMNNLKKEAKEAEDYPYMLSDGTRVRKDVDGNWIGQDGKKYPNQFN